MSDIPPEIIGDILSRLPVKSLLIFRCVSKSWRSLIDSNDFINLHLHRSSKTNSNLTLLVESTPLFYIDLYSFKQLDIGNAGFDPPCIAGSCNGLVLVLVNFDNLSLWNPCTRELNRLPIAPTERFKPYEVNASFALGYDSKHDDCKVVRVVVANSLLDGERVLSETNIYSLKTNSWKRVDDLPYMLPDGRWRVYVNDAIHTVVENSRNSKVIMAFDLAKEEHYEVPMPKSSRLSRGLLSVEVMGGCLAAVAVGKKITTEIWLMKEYGVKESSIKLLRFRPPIPEPCANLCPLAYSKSGDEVLLNYGGMCLNWYDLRKNTVTIACVSGLTASFNASPLDPPFHAEVCVGSLVSPYSPVAVEAGKQKGRQGKKGKEIKKKRLSQQSCDHFLCRFPLMFVQLYHIKYGV